jgi:hypothetical protein
MVNVEYGAGRHFDQYKINLGVAGYIYQKLVADRNLLAELLSSSLRLRERHATAICKATLRWEYDI